MYSRGMPLPVSATSTSTLPLWLPVRISSMPPMGMASRAFKKRFRNTCWSLLAEPRTVGIPSVSCFTSQIQVVKQLTEGIPTVRGSANKLQQVFLNLFLNARDAMPMGGMLEIRTGSHNGSVEVEVADTGNGIPREYIHKIFDPFFTTKPGGRGTGLGLSVTYGIIKEHSGKIDVRSTPGRGTSFHVEFPAVRKAVHV